MSYLCILDINSVSDILLANSFSWPTGCLFTLLIVFLAVKKPFSLMESHLFIFAFDVKSKKKNHCQDQCQGAYSLCLLGVLQLQVLPPSL